MADVIPTQFSQLVALGLDSKVNPAKKRRVLLVTSSYVPVTMADMHRVRHLAWELPKQGWEVEVLAPNSDFHRSEYLEPEFSSFFNSEVQVHQVGPRDVWFFKLLQLRSVGWRALRPMAIAGVKLLKEHRFDLIYISTASFSLFCLGRWWAREFSIPYVLDYHDPWVRDHIDYRTTPSRVKRWMGGAVSKCMEPYALHEAAGIVSVSPVYINELRQRYGDLECLRQERCPVIPFAGSERDLLAATPPAQDRGENFEVVYVGAGGPIMAKSFTTICAALAEVQLREPVLLKGLRIRLFGTSPYWKDGDPKPLQQIAIRFGLADIVAEIPPRVSFRKAMELVQLSDGLLILGVDDQGYMPSKLFNYALSGKPLLGCFQLDSPPVDIFRRRPGLGHLLTFNPMGDDSSRSVVAILQRFLTEVVRRERFDRRDDVADYSAPAMARRHAELFERICESGL